MSDGFNTPLTDFQAKRLEQPSNLFSQPHYSTPFVGRTHELTEISSKLDDPACRLLTLVGPGGIGKTRLALQAGQSLADYYPDGVYFVALQPISSVDHMVPAIADSLGLQFFSGGDPHVQLLHFLSEKSLLLILDNLEHLLPGGSTLTAEILAAAKDVKILATSRERLNLLEEWTLDIGGLQYPTDVFADLETYSAIRLFKQTAVRVRPLFNLTDEAPGVVRICQFVEGMPLGIELAASWARVLSSADISQQLANNLDMLETATRNMPPRHRSMRLVLEHSWTFLADTEQDILPKLSIFRGGFTREAAESVAGASLPLLASLIDKSWLRFNAQIGRYDLHELMRQYAESQLKLPDEAREIHERHATYYARFVSQREQDIKYQRQIPALDEIEADFDNIRAAWDWALRTQDSEAVNLMAEALQLFCDMRARWAEGDILFQQGISVLVGHPDPALRFLGSRLRTMRARLIILGKTDTETLDTLERWLHEHLSLSTAQNQPRDMAFALLILTRVEHHKHTRELENAEKCFNLYMMLDDRFYLAKILVHISFLLFSTTLERYHVGVELLRWSLNLSREVGDHNEASWTAFHVACILDDADHAAEAEKHIEEAIAYQRACNNHMALTYALNHTALRYFFMGEFEKAMGFASEALSLVSRWYMSSLTTEIFAVSGLLNVFLENYEQGQMDCQQAINSQGQRTQPEVIYALAGLAIAAYHADDPAALHRYLQMAAARLSVYINLGGQIRFLTWIVIPALSMAYALETKLEWAVQLLACGVCTPQRQGFENQWLEKSPLLNRVRQQLQTELGEKSFAAAWKRGAAMKLGDVADALLNRYPDSLATLLDTPTDDAQPPIHDLTSREVDILRLVEGGYTNRQIAEQLFITLGTVKWYLNDIYSKLGVNSRTQAIHKARELKLLT